MYKPNFQITPSINKNIAEIERIRAIIDRSRILPAREVVLRWRAIIEATRSSTGIEGNPLNEQQVAEVLRGKIPAAHERFITEVRNYRKALNYIEKRTQNKESFSQKDILRLHTIVMQGLLDKQNLGKWRKTQIYVVNIIKGKEQIVYHGPTQSKIPGLIDNLLEWVKEQKDMLHPILTAGILHYEFVSIHPFTDGNGRMTRLLTQLYLYQMGYDFRKVLVPDKYYFADRYAYYKALNQAATYNRQKIADQTQWLEYFINGFLTVAKEIKGKVVLATITRDSKEVLTLTQEEFQIIDFTQELGKVTVDDVVDMLELPKRTAQRRLKRLTDEEVLVRKGDGPATYYILKK